MGKMQNCGGIERRLIALLEELQAVEEKMNKLRKEIISMICGEEVIEGQLSEMEVNQKESTEPRELRHLVMVHLKNLGIPTSILGYKYLKEGIAMVVETPELGNSMTKMLYPTLAKKFSSTSSKVERAIRHAIEKGCEHVGVKTLNEYFGEALDKGDKPTNSMFISTLVEIIQEQLDYQH